MSVDKRVKTILIVMFSVSLYGCVTASKMATTGAGAVAGGVVAGVPGAVGGAIAGDLVGEVIVDPIMSIGEKTHAVEEKVESAWGLLAKLGESAAWVVAGVLIIPLILGYLIPSPHRRKE